MDNGPKVINQTNRSSVTSHFFESSINEEELDDLPPDKINFDKQMNKYKKLTEMELPYTNT